MDEALTPRQREVVALVAQGLTNREIADLLFISERTAEGHVEQIRRKLGLRSRLQIANWVAQQSPPTAVARTPAPDAPPVAGPPVPRPARRRPILVAVVAAALAVLVLGVVASRSNQKGPETKRIHVIAGGDRLIHPSALAVDVSGSVFVIEQHRILRIAPSGDIRVVAGQEAAGFGGDGGPADRATVNSPRSLAVDTDGSVYVADTANNRVRRIRPDGVIITAAGTGSAGFSGDGGPAANAQLSGPAGLAIGFSHSLYVADSGNNRIRMVRPDGTIATVAGTGDPGYAGDGGAATSALLDTPEGLAFDHEGNLYIADTANDRVRVLNVAGVIATVAGNGQDGDGGDRSRATLASLHLAAGPVYSAGEALAVDDAGDLFIADALNNRIRMVNVNGTIDTVAGTGRMGESEGGTPAKKAGLNVPLGVAVGEAAALYVADGSNNRILAVR